MDVEKQYIACLDSGIGGISVLGAARRLMPAENFIYFGDLAHAPYGDKPAAMVRKIVLEQVEKLQDYGLKALLLACNTATSATVASLRQQLAIPVLGMEPALKPAMTGSAGTVLVLATALTLREKKFAALLAKLKAEHAGREVLPLPCPGLMELIENEAAESETALYLEELLAPYAARMVAAVLGCTHYVFLRPLLHKMYPKLALFDGNQGVCRHLQRSLAERQLLGGRGELRFMTSLEGPAGAKFVEKCQRFLQKADAMEEIGQ